MIERQFGCNDLCVLLLLMYIRLCALCHARRRKNWHDLYVIARQFRMYCLGLCMSCALCPAIYDGKIDSTYTWLHDNFDVLIRVLLLMYARTFVCAVSCEKTEKMESFFKFFQNPVMYDDDDEDEDEEVGWDFFWGGRERGGTLNRGCIHDSRLCCRLWCFVCL